MVHSYNIFTKHIQKLLCKQTMLVPVISRPHNVFQRIVNKRVLHKMLFVCFHIQNKS